jgi:hypothetical protein
MALLPRHDPPQQPQRIRWRSGCRGHAACEQKGTHSAASLFLGRHTRDPDEDPPSGTRLGAHHRPGGKQAPAPPQHPTSACTPARHGVLRVIANASTLLQGRITTFQSVLNGALRAAHVRSLCAAMPCEIRGDRGQGMGSALAPSGYARARGRARERAGRRRGFASALSPLNPRDPCECATEPSLRSDRNHPLRYLFGEGFGRFCDRSATETEPAVRTRGRRSSRRADWPVVSTDVHPNPLDL